MKSLRGDISILFSLIIVDHGIDSFYGTRKSLRSVRTNLPRYLCNLTIFLMREMNERFFSTMKNIKSFDISILFPLIIVDHGIDSILLWNEEKFKIHQDESSTIFVQFNNFFNA